MAKVQGGAECHGAVVPSYFQGLLWLTTLFKMPLSEYASSQKLIQIHAKYPKKYINKYINIYKFFLLDVTVWTLNCTRGVGWTWSTVKYISHYLPQLPQSLAGRWNVCGKECKTTVGVIRKDKRENEVNGPGPVSRGGTSDSWWQKWTLSIVGGQISSDHINYSKRTFFDVPPQFSKKKGLYEHLICILKC